MPYEWVDPEIAFVISGVKIYHCYAGDVGNEQVLEFWYTTDPRDSDEDGHGEFRFDVRDLRIELTRDYHVSMDARDPKELIKHAIRLNLLKLSPDQIISHHIGRGGVRCPVCNTTREQSTVHTGAVAVINQHCRCSNPECNTRWTNIYYLADMKIGQEKDHAIA